MPAARQDEPGLDIKPYDRPKASTPNRKESKPDISSPSKRVGVAGRKWSSDELLQLFEHVLKNGPRNWEGVIEGRTVNQCQQTWSKTLVPFLKNSIMAKGA
ncbi:hypothetical protein IAT40_000902 [Kwoniella sp. CBS 6097]